MLKCGQHLSTARPFRSIYNEMDTFCCFNTFNIPAVNDSGMIMILHLSGIVFIRLTSARRMLKLTSGGRAFSVFGISFASAVTFLPGHLIS